MRSNGAAVANDHPGADDAVGTYGDISAYLRAALDNCSGVDGHYESARAAHSKSALATCLPSTRVAALYMPMLRIRRFWATSNTSWSPSTPTWLTREFSIVTRQ